MPLVDVVGLFTAGLPEVDEVRLPEAHHLHDVREPLRLRRVLHLVAQDVQPGDARRGFAQRRNEGTIYLSAIELFDVVKHPLRRDTALQGQVQPAPHLLRDLGRLKRKHGTVEELGELRNRDLVMPLRLNDIKDALHVDVLADEVCPDILVPRLRPAVRILMLVDPRELTVELQLGALRRCIAVSPRRSVGTHVVRLWDAGTGRYSRACACGCACAHAHAHACPECRPCLMSTGHRVGAAGIRSTAGSASTSSSRGGRAGS